MSVVYEHIKIERNIPPPESKRMTKYPWGEMKVGDSFLFPEGKAAPSESARSASQRYKPKRFVARRTEDGYRCWRVE
jgi:hypothetical protein